MLLDCTSFDELSEPDESDEFDGDGAIDAFDVRAACELSGRGVAIDAAVAERVAAQAKIDEAFVRSIVAAVR